MNEQNSSRPHVNKKLYHSYLLRLWCTDQADTGCWRASLEDSHTGERIGFASLEELFAFLMEKSQLGAKPEGSIQQQLSEGGIR